MTTGDGSGPNIEGDEDEEDGELITKVLYPLSVPGAVAAVALDAGMGEVNRIGLGGRRGDPGESRTDSAVVVLQLLLLLVLRVARGGDGGVFSSIGGLLPQL